MLDTKDFLLEIGCEEMPSAPLMKAQEQLGKIVEKGLKDAGLAHGAVRTISTPRRLAVIVDACATATEEIHEVVRGPKSAIAFDADGNPTRTAEGFARKNKTTAAELVRRVEADGNEYVFAERNIASVPAIELLSTLCEQTIGAIQWPNYRSQRWGSEHQTFVRPIRWICALLGHEVVPVSYADVKSANTTRGHRVMGAGEHVVDEPRHPATSACSRTPSCSASAVVPRSFAPALRKSRPNVAARGWTRLRACSTRWLTSASGLRW